MGDPNCYTCDNCLENCYACPDSNITNKDGGNLYTRGQGCSVFASRRKRIWGQSRMSSSMGLLRKRSMIVSKQVGQGACPKTLGEAGGPGDLQSAIQKSCSVATYNMGRLKNRTAYRNKSGVDRKHGSYQRYLARRVGGELRKEKMPTVLNRTAYIGQPRNRTGTSCSCGKKLTECEQTPLKDTMCCDNRIPNNDDVAKFTGLKVLSRTGVAQKCCC